MKSSKTSFTVYSKVLLSSNTCKRASGKLITENNEKLELCAYWASSLQEICDKRERGKSLCVLCTSSKRESRKVCLPNYRRRNTGVSARFLTRNCFSLLFQWGQGEKGLTCKRPGTVSAPNKDRNQWNRARVIPPTDRAIGFYASLFCRCNIPYRLWGDFQSVFTEHQFHTDLLLDPTRTGDKGGTGIYYVLPMYGTLC